MKSAAIPSGLIFLLILAGHASVPPYASPTEAKTSGWIDIMPGPGLGRWTRVAIPPGRQLSKQSQWSVDAATRTLVCAGGGGHEWLRYGRKLGNFQFHVEWRLVEQPGAKNYNSGVFVRNDKGGQIWYQAQIGSASGGYWFGNDQAGKGPISFDLHSAMTSRPVKMAGEWNSFDIRCQGPKLILSVNGIKASEFDQCKNRRGYLGLEAEGSRIEFRSLRIKMLP